MRGPWSRHLAAAFPGVPTGEATDVRVEAGAIFAEVDGCRVTLLAPVIPAGVWTAVERFARNRSALQAGVEGRAQSEQLAHMLAQDWEEPLVPERDEIARLCTCDARGACGHVAAVGNAIADSIDDDPAVLLRWRGCLPSAPRDPWQSAAIPEIAPARPRPAGTVLMCLGESGVNVGNGDVAEALRRAYDAFAARPG